MSNEFICKICDITCTGKAPYDQHIISAKHMKKASVYQTQTSSAQSHSPTPTPKPSSPLPTTTYNIPDDASIPSVSVPISAETMRILLEWNHPFGYKPYCDICQLPLYGENIADIHFASDNNLHTQKLAAWKQIRENDARYSCKVCSEIFITENLMRDHFNSDKHAAVIQRKMSLEKIIKIYETYTKLKEARRQPKETNSIVDLENEFQKLNVIDGTETKIKSSSDNLPINFAMLQQAMHRKSNEDDD